MRKIVDIREVEDLTKNFILSPRAFDAERYEERTNRNLGWITPSEQEILQQSTVGIAGCGGMGGLLSATLLRAGIGYLKIADLEVFDESNLNRQIAANQKSIGQSKAIETAKMLRNIADDTSIHVYPEGICPETISSFSQKCDVICDEIEFWAVGARLLLHENIGRKTIILNGNSVGMGTRLFRFAKAGQWHMRDVLRMSLEEATVLESKIRSGTATTAERRRVLESVLHGLVPKMPEYIRDQEVYSTEAEVQRRLLVEGKASIIGTNPPMATGFLANHVILQLLQKKSSLKRKVEMPPSMPGYLYFDAALMKAEKFLGIWWT